MAVSQKERKQGRMSPGTEVIALYSFKGNASEDLSFTKKEILTIVKPTRDPMWYLAKNQDGYEGMIPANYVKALDPVPMWFHGKISRFQAEELLLSREPGLFLVRESANYPGDYTLCACADNRVEYYRIISKNNKFTIDEEEHFADLSELVEHYKQVADGLCSKLNKACARHGNPVDTAPEVLKEQGWTNTNL